MAGGAHPRDHGELAGLTIGRHPLARRGTARAGSGRTEPTPASNAPDITPGGQVDPDEDHGDGMEETDQELENFLHYLNLPAAPWESAGPHRTA